jgi:uncharacterized membrane protein YdjX (TVP38/TMEM64 family)
MKRRIPSGASGWCLVGFVALIIVATGAGHLVGLPELLVAMHGWTFPLGDLAPAAYAALYVAVTMVGVPGAPLVILAALLFGSGRAVVAMAAASVVSAVLAFLIARHVARDSLTTRLAGTRAYERLSRLVERHDALVIPFVRIVPVLPFALVNYGLGLTGIPFWRYALWSILSLVPVDAALVLGANALYEAAAAGASPPFAGTLVLGAGLMILMIAVWRRLLPRKAYALPAACDGQRGRSREVRRLLED